MTRFILICLASLLTISCGKSEPTPGKVEAIPTVQVYKLTDVRLEQNIRLTGDLLAFQSVEVYAKVPAFIDHINVDRGSQVKKGDVLAQLVEPELDRRIEEAKANYSAAQDQYDRSKTLSVQYISPLQLELYKAAAESTKKNMESLLAEKNYLIINAPFDGYITRRNLHEGALVIAGGSSGAIPIFKIETITKLRLVVHVPERQLASIVIGKDIQFNVQAFPTETFTGKIARYSHSLDPKTRTETVELDVDNTNLKLAPGMFANVIWPISSFSTGFLVPKMGLVTTTEEIFVIRVKNGKTEWVNVERGAGDDKEIEVFGNLQLGDLIVVPGSDEIRSNMPVKIEMIK